MHNERPPLIKREPNTGTKISELKFSNLLLLLNLNFFLSRIPEPAVSSHAV